MNLFYEFNFEFNFGKGFIKWKIKRIRLTKKIVEMKIVWIGESLTKNIKCTTVQNKIIILIDVLVKKEFWLGIFQKYKWLFILKKKMGNKFEVDISNHFNSEEIGDDTFKNLFNEYSKNESKFISREATFHFIKSLFQFYKVNPGEVRI